MKTKIAIFSYILIFALCSCATNSDPHKTTKADPSIPDAKVITKTIVGSAESPDPILEEVQRLEKEGVLKDVKVMESFPVQISVTGPQDVIERLEKMSRKKLE